MKTLLLSLFLSSPLATAGNTIALGTLKGIKVYDYSSSKVTKFYFSDESTSRDVSGCNGVANMTHSQRSETAINQIMSMALAAYMSGKKIRAYSSSDTCELDFMALQESIF